jgi:hypothetical protein
VVFFMSHEIHKAAQESPDSWRAHLRLKAGIMLGVAGLVSAAGTSKNTAEAASESYGISLVGFTDNSMFTENLADAEASATRIQQMGGTSIRIAYPLNKDTAWENYAKETCNVFQAAHDHGLQPIITFRGVDGQPGYIPQSQTEIKHFKAVIGGIMWTVASKKDNKHPGGCVPGQTVFTFEGPNEINNHSPEFNRNYGINTPVQAAKIDYQLSKFVKKEAARPEIQATAYYGESLSAANNDPIQHLRDEAQAAKKLGYEINLDFVDIHPYPKDPTADPSLTMQALYQPAKEAINELSPGAELVWGEIGVNTTNPPSSEATAYSQPVLGTRGVSEATQVKYITNVLKTAASEGTDWVTLFDVQDDGSGNMPSSGEFYVSGKPKSSQPGIRYQIGKYTGR